MPSAIDSGGSAPGDDSSVGSLDGPEIADGASLPDAMPSSQGDGGAVTTGNAPYSPCPAKATPCKIMPLGDSITQGYRSTNVGGYRVELFLDALNDKKNITFVGSQTDGPTTVGGQPFPRSHEGHGGYTIDGPLGIQPQVVAWMTAAKPDIITLMVGTNDVNNYYAWKTESATDLANAPMRLAKLIDTIVAQDSHVFLFVAQITPTTIDAENVFVQTYNSAIPGIVKARADAGKHVVLVDMYTPFVNTANYQTVLLRGTKDSLHPMDAGYKVMGDVWYAALKPLLP